MMSKIYVMRDPESREIGTVFHLRPGCGAGEPVEIKPEVMKNYRKLLGIRRICLRCRKAATKESGQR